MEEEEEATPVRIFVHLASSDSYCNQQAEEATRVEVVATKVEAATRAEVVEEATRVEEEATANSPATRAEEVDTLVD